MNWWKKTPATDTSAETTVERLLAPLKSVAPGTPVARQSLLRALQASGGSSAPVQRGLRAWQRALVGAGAVFVPLFAVGSVAGLGGSPIGSPLDAVAGVFKSDAGSPPGGPLAIDETPSPTPQPVVDTAVATGTGTCADATANALEILQGLLDAGILPESGSAGVTAALEAIEECGTGDGAAVTCLDATATAREVLQALLDTETMPAEGRTGIERAIAAIDACGGDDDETEDTAEATAEETPAAEDQRGGPGTGHKTCFEATAHAREILQSLLDDEDRPDQSKKGLERALEALENCGTGNGKGSDDPAPTESAATPEATPAAAEAAAPAHGKPDSAGKPDDVGKPETPGQQGASGKPDTAGKPADPGKPATTGSPAGGTQADGDSPHGPPDHAGGPSGGNHGHGQGGGNGTPGGNGGGPSNRPGRP